MWKLTVIIFDGKVSAALSRTALMEYKKESREGNFFAQFALINRSLVSYREFARTGRNDGPFPSTSDDRRDLCRHLIGPGDS